MSELTGWTKLLAAILALAMAPAAWADEPTPHSPGASPDTPGPPTTTVAPIGAAGEDGDALLTPARMPRLFDARFEPIALLRMSFIHTFEDVVTIGDTEIDSSRADASPFGHRVGFVLENVEFGAAGRFNDLGVYYKAKLELVPREKDGNRSSDYLKDAYLGWDRFTFFDARAGNMKIPFSQANNVSTKDRPLAYNPTLDTLIPRRQLGLRLSGGDPWGIVRAYFGVYNSAKQSVEQIRDFDQLLFVGRLELRVHELLAQVAAKPSFDFEFQIGGGAAWAQENFDPATEHRWLGMDMHLKIWRFTLQSEFVFKDYYDEPDTNQLMKSHRGFGWHVDLSFEAIPRWLDVTVRVEEMDAETDIERGNDASLAIDDTARQAKRWITAGVTVHFDRYARILLNYIHRQELEGISLDNDVILALFQFDL